MKPLLTLALALLLLPQITFAQPATTSPADFVTITEEGTIATGQGFVPCEGTGCNACHLVVLVNTIVKWLITMSFLLFSFLAVKAGVNLVISGGNPAAKSAAKSAFNNAFIGLFIILGAWLLIDTLLKGILDDEGSGFGPWSQITCGEQLASTSTPQVARSGGGVSGVRGNNPPVVGAAGACDADIVRNYFPNQVGNAQCIIGAESSCGGRSVSSTDRMFSDGNRAFSFGPMQINVTVHPLVGCGPSGATLNCPSAFRGRNYSAVVVNEQLYQECAAAAQNVACNLRNGAIIQNQRSGWNAWSTARQCGLRT